MQVTNGEARDLYAGRVRARVCGICTDAGKVLLINHSLYGHRFLMPPGGGIEFGEAAADALKREFLEETGLDVTVGKMLFTHEFISEDLHGIELFFKVKFLKGSLKKGYDPELSLTGQILGDAHWMSWDELKKLPANELHRIFSLVKSLDELENLPAFIPASLPIHF